MCFDALYRRIGRVGWGKAVLCSLVVIVLTGCAQDTPVAPPPEPITILFGFPSADTFYYVELAKRFNETHPDVEVVLRTERGDDSEGAIADDVDAFVAPSYVVEKLREQGDILGLGLFLEQDPTFDLSGYYPVTLEAFTQGGQMWAIPAGADVGVMYYNQDLFDRYNVPYPQIGWTWDDFLDLASAVRQPSAGVFGYSPLPGFSDARSFVYQHGGRLLDDLREPTRTVFDDPVTIEALEWYALLFRGYDVAPTFEQARETFGPGTGGRIYYQGINNGQVGMWLGWFSARGGPRWGAVDWEDLRWGMVTLPADARSATEARINGYFISSYTQHPEACWQWITFVSQQIPSSAAYPTRAISPRRSFVESDEYEQLVGREIVLVAQASMESAAFISPDPAEFERVLDLFYAAVEEVVDEYTLPEEALTRAQRQAEAQGLTGRP